MKINSKNVASFDVAKINKEILNSVASISYGEIVITIHDKKVVQIEKREKKRF